MKSPGNSKNLTDQRDNGIMESIAALRSVLMLDTPIRDVLAVGRNVNDAEREPQKKLSFSPTPSTQATTPASKNTPVLGKSTSAGEYSQNLPPLSGHSSSPSFNTLTPSGLRRSPEVQSATKILQKKIQLLEASHAELEDRLKGELDQRTSLKTTYDKLSEFQAKQSSQLKQITMSRDAFREESIALKKTLETERNNHGKTIAFLKNTTNTTIESQILREKESFRNETSNLRKQLLKSERRCAESEVLVKSLTKEVERLNTDVKELQRNHESAMQRRSSSHATEIAGLQDKIAQTESGLIEQINKERKNAEETNEKLQKIQKHLAKQKEEYSSEKEKMKVKRIMLQDSLKAEADERKAIEQQLTEATDNVSRLRKELNNEKLTREKAEGKVKELTSELESANNQLSASKNLQSERDDLKHKLLKAEKDLMNSSAEKSPHIAIETLHSEKSALEQQLMDATKGSSALQNELQETKMELDGLKLNLEEAERIELQNEELISRLKLMSEDVADVENLREQLNTYKSDLAKKDQLLQSMDLELEKVRAKSQRKSDGESSDSFHGNNDSKVIEKLQQELRETKEELAHSKEKLGISKSSNLSRLVEVATHREKVRYLEGHIEELKEQWNGEIQEADENDKKRENEGEESPRKRMKTGEDIDVYECEDDELVL